MTSIRTQAKTRWTTSITDASASGVRIRGYDLSELSRKVDFAGVFYLLSVGELPSPKQARILNALMIAACDRGITPSSAISRTVASCGVPLQAAVAAGVMTFGDVQGGVGTQMAEALVEAIGDIRHRLEAGAEDTREIARRYIKGFTAAGARVPGYGQPLHPEGDPRARRLIDYAFELGVDGNALIVGLEAEKLLAEEKGRPIPMNVDGAIACIAVDIGMPSQIIRAINFVARSAGLAAHVVEEMETAKGFRILANDDEVTYRGAPPRDVPDDYVQVG